MISLNECDHATSLTKPNHDLAPLRSLGVGKSLVADKMLSDGVIPNDVIFKPAKMMVCLEN